MINSWTELSTVLLAAASVALTAAFVTFLVLGIRSAFKGAFAFEGGDGLLPHPALVRLKGLGSLNRELIWPTYEERLRRALVRAGEPGSYQPQDILAMQEVGGVLGLVLGLAGAHAFGTSLAWSIPVAALGALYPLLWLKEQINHRQTLLTEELGHTMDLLTLMVEAGLDFRAGVAKLVEKGEPGPLRDELALVLKELKLGKTREDALRQMSVRVDMPALDSFVAILIQADRVGSSLGSVLRIQSTQLRVNRSLRAEKAAAEAPVRLLFPLVMCIFPTVFLVLFGPIAYHLLHLGLH